MNMSTCERCGGLNGAHYMECVVGRLFERLMGPGYPWKAPAPHALTAVREDLTREEAAQILRQRIEAAEPPRATGAVVSGSVEAEHLGRRLALLDAQLQREAEASVALDRDQTHTIGEEPPVKPVKPVKAGRNASPLAESVAAFIEQHTEDCDPEYGVEVEALRTRYNEWADEPMVRPQFAQYLSRVLDDRYEKRAGNTTQGRGVSYAGLRLIGVEPKLMPAETRKGSAARAVATRLAGVQEHVLAFAAERLTFVAPDSEHNGTPWVQRTDYVSSPALTEAYNEWAKQTGHPQANQADVSQVIKSLGYKTRQTFAINGIKPAIFFGITLRGENEAAPEQPADDKEEDPTARIRALIEANKRRVVIDHDARYTDDDRLADQRGQLTNPLPSEKTNNGWFKPPTSGADVELPALTVQDILDEHPEVAKRDRRTGPPLRRPRQGQITNKDVRKLVNKAVDQGYIYWLDGSNHPKIRHPEDPMQVVGCAGSASDVNAPRQVARDLRRIGVQL